MFASPVLSNARLPGEKGRGLPISCYLSYVPDSLEGLMYHSTETRWLAIMGGGVGGHWPHVRAVSDKAPGPIPFIHTVDADMEAYKQGKVRRGSYASYMSIDHPDIVEFLNLRLPTGDASRKCHSPGFHHAVNITDDFMNAVLDDLPWNLVDPHSKEIRETLSARGLWQQILEIRYRTGEPYLFFIDTANRALPDAQKALGLKINGSNLCCEIVQPTNDQRTAVCCLSSLNAEKYDEWKDTSLVEDLVTMLDNVLDEFIANAPDTISKASFSAMRERSIGLGLMGFHNYLQSKMVPFESEAARQINKEMFSNIKSQAVQASRRLAVERGEAPDMAGTGMRNAHLLALAPNANSAILLGTSPSIEPNNANAYNHQTRAGSWLVINKYLKRLLAMKGKDTDQVWTNIITSKGSVQHLDFLSAHEKSVFKTAIELDQMWVVQHAADRQQYICQAQSVNLFFPPNADKSYLNKVHIAAWRKGLKSLYYMRTMSPYIVQSVSNKLTRIALKDGVHVEAVQPTIVQNIDARSEEQSTECVACHG
jgi:ribonucleoside-diphosphate reductase alpha chain